MLSLLLLMTLVACGQKDAPSIIGSTSSENTSAPSDINSTEVDNMDIQDGFVLIKGGSFQMGALIQRPGAVMMTVFG
jgi:formylglycine-generating enzyme required for sulfatase activity